MPICVKLNKLMSDHGIAVNVTAEKVGITNVNISRIKTGHIKAFRLSTLDKLIEAFEEMGIENCNVNDIIEYVPLSDLTKDHVVCYPDVRDDPKADC